MMSPDQYCVNLPGRIVEYFPETQTATVKICVEKTYGDTEVEAGKTIREDLQDVPVHTPGGGGWHMTFPIKEGDTCQLTFSQIGYDYWLFNDKDESGTLSGLPKPHLYRQFSEDDGYALVGYNTLPRAVQDYSAVHSQWRNADALQQISLNEDLSIDIKAGTTVINITKDGAIAITAPLVTVTGDLTVDGTITSNTSVVSPSMVTGGKELTGHNHPAGTPPGNTGANN
tara:strand:- start:7359 stop:8042 length:684 start_codon:yes stop_codon:yes gene_type:complete